MRTGMTSAFKRAAFAQQTGEAVLTLLELTHPSFAAPIRVVNDAQDLTSNGVLYQRFPFQISWPNDQDESPPRVMLSIDNVDRRIVESIRATTSPIAVRASLVKPSAPDDVEAGPIEFVLRDTEFNELVVEGTLAFEDHLNEPYPAVVQSPTRFPALFA